MSIQNIMEENGLDMNWLFSHAKLSEKEGLIFFEVSLETDEMDVEYQALTPKCVFIDGAKFNITDDNEKDITLNTIDNNIILNRIDGLEIKLDKNAYSDFPFYLEEFSKVKLQFTQPQDTIEITD